MLLKTVTLEYINVTKALVHVKVRIAHNASQRLWVIFAQLAYVNWRD
jgi:hypothetical protein